MTNEIWEETWKLLEYIEDFQNQFKTYGVNLVTYNVEYVVENIQGHPDIVIDNTILDIKTTLNFQQMMDESLLQILCYVTLARVNGENPIKMGIVLPLQKYILIIDVSKFDSSLFLSFLLEGNMSKVNVEYNPLKNVGTHFG